MSTEPTPTPETKPPRKRKTKTEKDAERAALMAAEAAKPIDPLVWLILGALLLGIGGFIYIDPVGFSSANQQGSGSWIQTFLVLLTSFIGKNPTAAILAILGLLSLGWGVRGWLQQRTKSAE